METGLSLEVREVAGARDAVSVTLHGPIDAKSVLGFKSEVSTLLGRGIGRFILDLSDVKYVNSTGLAFLINLAETSGDGKNRVILVGMQPKVKIIFETMGVVDFFGAAPSVAVALKALGKAPPAAPPGPIKRRPSPSARPAPPPPPAPAPAVKRDQSSTKTGRVRPPTTHAPPRPKNWFARLFQKLFGRR
jgi:anti-anti-sigma factor